MFLKQGLLTLCLIATCLVIPPDRLAAGEKYHYYSRNPYTYRSFGPHTYTRKKNNYRPATYSYYQQRNYGKRKYGYTPREYTRKQNRYDKAISYSFGYPYGYPFGFWGYPFYWGGFWRGYWGSYYGAPYRFYYYRPWYHPYGGGYYHSLYRPWYLRSPADQSEDSARRRARAFPIHPDLQSGPLAPVPQALLGPVRPEEELVQASTPEIQADNNALQVPVNKPTTSLKPVTTAAPEPEPVIEKTPKPEEFKDRPLRSRALELY